MTDLVPKGHENRFQLRRWVGLTSAGLLTAAILLGLITFAMMRNAMQDARIAVESVRHPDAAGLPLSGIGKADFKSENTSMAVVELDHDKFKGLPSLVFAAFACAVAGVISAISWLMLTMYRRR